LREELDNLHKPGSYVGEIVKAMGKTKVIFKHLLFALFFETLLFLHSLHLHHVNHFLSLSRFL